MTLFAPNATFTPNTRTAALAKMGMDRHTGRLIADKLEHIRQSLADIFTTPIGERVQRRWYGSRIFALLDSPMNEVGRLRLIAALVDAAYRFEPRVVITWANIIINTDGKVMLDYVARTIDGQDLTGQIVIR